MRISQEAVQIITRRLDFVRDKTSDEELIDKALSHISTQLEGFLGLSEMLSQDSPGHEYLAILSLMKASPECLAHPGDAGIIARTALRWCLLQTALIEAGISLLPDAYAKKEDLQEYEDEVREWLDNKEKELTD